MLAGVNYVLMGAGIPKDVPAALDALAEHRPATLRLDVESPGGAAMELLVLDPAAHLPAPHPPLVRPAFLPIIASNSLATMLARKASGRIDGFIIEGPTAGGHNAPPRGQAQFNDRGEPIYGPRDEVDLAQIRELGLPFWLAGGTGTPEALTAARAAGAAGVQVGTLFAYCDESGLAPDLKQAVLDHAVTGDLDLITDPRASPTGFPFKVVHWPGDPTDETTRDRICDLGYLRIAYKTESGSIGFRCPAEPVQTYAVKGGRAEDAEGRKCLCNGLMANIGLAQESLGGAMEPPLLTSGDDVLAIPRFLHGRTHYSATDVIDYLLGTSVPA
jgi:NAD(P)H-dependent flavin oxidoreductase YrpB (nitropropane dioxygenase family)